MYCIATMPEKMILSKEDYTALAHAVNSKAQAQDQNKSKEEKTLKIERGDSVKFGKKWCKSHGRKDLIDKVVTFTPQWFEEDNGLYCSEIECPGIQEEGEEADSIYHLFGNHFERFMDCALIKGSQDDISAYQKIIQDRIDAESKYWEQMADSIEKVI